MNSTNNNNKQTIQVPTSSATNVVGRNGQRNVYVGTHLTEQQQLKQRANANGQRNVYVGTHLTEQQLLEQAAWAEPDQLQSELEQQRSLLTGFPPQSPVIAQTVAVPVPAALPAAVPAPVYVPPAVPVALPGMAMPNNCGCNSIDGHVAAVALAAAVAVAPAAVAAAAAACIVMLVCL